MKLLKISTLILIALTMSGCVASESNANVANINKTEQNNNIDNEEEARKQEERSKQTLWSVLDADGNDKEMLNESNEDVKQIIKLIENHCLSVDNRDFEQLKIEDEYKLYKEQFIKVLDKGNYKESVELMYESNKLSLNHENLVWYRNYFNEDITTCKVTIESEFTIKEAEEEYLSKNQMKLNEVYQEKRMYYLEKDNDEWKIINVEKGALTKRN